MIRSHTLLFSDFETDWYKQLAKELKQDKNNLDNHQIKANKFWQNAIIAQAILERIDLSDSPSGVGFGVGRERLPALFAKKGIDILATDQDFKTEKAKHWDQYELAKGTSSLNSLGICPDKTFAERVSYMSVDMKNVPKKLHGSYDFVWSNCALGHLGSIEEGLKFIEESLKCLKPGGVAVHTTEFNVLSDDQTSTSGSTVIFRPKDIRRFYKKLIARGYECSPVRYTLGKTAYDNRVSINPQFGNDYSKIQVNGHLATQGVIIIRKPSKQPVSRSKTVRQTIANRNAYYANLRAIAKFKKTQPIRDILRSQKLNASHTVITPLKQKQKVNLKKAGSTTVFVKFKNDSAIPLFALYSRLGDSKPIVLGTWGPADRPSQFVGESWVGEHANRAAHQLFIFDSKGVAVPADYIKPGDIFGYQVELQANKTKPGTYSEEFCVVQEHLGWIESSKTVLEVTVN